MEVRGSLEIAGLEKLSADPTTELYIGRLYWNTTSNVIRLYANGIWNTVGTASTTAPGTVKYELQIDADLDISGATAESLKYGYLMYSSTPANDVARTITLPQVASGEIDQAAIMLSSYYFSSITVQTPDGKLFRNQDGSTSATKTIQSNEHLLVFYDPDLGDGEWIVTETAEDDESKLNQIKRVSANLDLTDFYITNQKTNLTSRFDIPISIINESTSSGTTVTLFDGTSLDAFIVNKQIAIYNPTEYSIDVTAFTAQTIKNSYSGASSATVTLAARSYLVLAKASSQYEIVQSNDPALANIPIALNDLKDTNAPAPEDGQALVWNQGTTRWIAGASGDASFKLQSISGQDLTVKSGTIILNDGRELRTSSGNDLTVDLSSYGDDSYYFYIDMTLVPNETLVSGRSLIDVEASDIVALTTEPTETDPLRYIPLGGATKATTWSSLFSTAFRRHDTQDSSQVNLFVNGNLEKGLSSWTSTKPAQISLERSSPLDGLQSLKVTSDGAGQIVSTTLKLSSDARKTIQHGIEGVIDIPTTASLGDWVARFKRNGTTIANSESDLAPGRNRLQDLMAGFAPLGDTISFEIEDVSASASDVATCDIFVLTPQGQGSVREWPSYDQSEVGIAISNYNVNYVNLIPSKDAQGHMYIEGEILGEIITPGPGNQIVSSLGFTFSEDKSWAIGNVGSSVYKAVVDISTANDEIVVNFGGASGASIISIVIPRIRIASWPTWATKGGNIQLLDNSGLYQNVRAQANSSNGQSVNHLSIIVFETATRNDLGLYDDTTGLFTSNFKGTLLVNSSVGLSNSDALRLGVVKNGTIIIRGPTNNSSSMVSGEIEVDVGDTIGIDNNSGATVTLTNNSQFNNVSFSRVPDSTGNQATGANTSYLANENPQNVLVNYQKTTIDLSTDPNAGAFNSGILTVIRIGDNITITSDSAITHSNGSNNLSSDGLLPEWARPTSNSTMSIYTMDTSRIRRATVSIAGRLSLYYLNWSGAVNADTSSGNPPTITFNLT